MFHRKYPNKKVSASKLRRLYLANGVRRKEIKVAKLLPESTVRNFDQQRDAVLTKLRQAKADNLPVLFLDEIVFTKRSLITRTWSAIANTSK